MQMNKASDEVWVREPRNLKTNGLTPILTHFDMKGAGALQMAVVPVVFLPIPSFPNRMIEEACDRNDAKDSQ